MHVLILKKRVEHDKHRGSKGDVIEAPESVGNSLLSSEVARVATKEEIEAAAATAAAKKAKPTK